MTRTYCRSARPEFDDSDDARRSSERPLLVIRHSSFMRHWVVRHASFLLFLALPSVLTAQTVKIDLTRDAVYGAEDVDLYVRISGRVSNLAPPRLDPVAGLVIRGPSSPRQSTQIINGHMTRETTYLFRLTPRTDNPRTYEIGPVTLTRRGQAPLTSNRVTLKVYRQPPRGVSFTRTVSRNSGATLSPFRVTYTVYYSGQRADDEDRTDARSDLRSGRRRSVRSNFRSHEQPGPTPP